MGYKGPAAGGNDPGADQIILHRVVDQVPGGQAGIDIEAGDGHGVVVVKHQPAALLVGIIKGHLPRPRIVGRSRRPYGDRVPTESNHMSGTFW